MSEALSLVAFVLAPAGVFVAVLALHFAYSSSSAWVDGQWLPVASPSFRFFMRVAWALLGAGVVCALVAYALEHFL